jgi:DNA-binding NarL/FixJ family response regulator
LSRSGVRTVVLIGDETLVHDGISALINRTGDLRVVGALPAAVESMELVRAMQPDVVVCDSCMPGRHGLQLIQRLGAEAGVVLLGIDEEHMDWAIECGAAGYVSKRSPAQHLFQAIRTAADGGIYTDPTIADKTSSNSAASASRGRSATSKLTPREAEVVHLIAFGYSNKEIAGQLGIGIKSIETYKARACEKLDMRSRSDLVRYAIMQGWLGTYPSAG